MIALVQRVNHASVNISGKEIAAIGQGMLVFIGVEKADTAAQAHALFDKLRKFRIFSDESGKMNLNIEQAQGEILLVPQFTLPAETNKGNRPGFDPVAAPELGKQLFEQVVDLFEENTSLTVGKGQFQADMKVLLENDGPLTFWLKK